MNEWNKEYRGPVIDFDGLSVLPDIYRDLLRSARVPSQDITVATTRFAARLEHLASNERGIAVLKDICGAANLSPEDVGIHPPSRKQGWFPSEWRNGR